jgi:hypothetical protein
MRTTLIRDDNGQAWIWHASATMAQEALTEQGSPVAGDRIAVLFGGEGKAGNGNKFERWAVASEPSRARTLHERMITVEDVELRHRIKKTSARLHGSLLRLDPTGLDTVEAWLDRAIAGELELDPV